MASLSLNTNAPSLGGPAGLASPTSNLTPELIKSVDTVYVVSNELGRKETFARLQKLQSQEGLRGNAIIGCSGLEVLNMASALPGITHVGVFDMSKNVEKFWRQLSKILSEPGVETDQCRINVLQFLKQYKPKEMDYIHRDCQDKISFLCSKEKFQRIQKIFQEGHFSFKRMDLGDSFEVMSFFADQEKRGAVPHLVYISNIALMVTGAQMNHNLDRYKEFENSMDMIPPKALVLDSVLLPGDIYSTQRLHTNGPDISLMPDLDRSHIATAIQADDYDGVKYCLAHGAGGDLCFDNGMPFLNFAAGRGLDNAIDALVEGGADVNIADDSGFTPLHQAASRGKAQTIEMLIGHGANLEAVDDQQMTPLHRAAVMGELEAVRMLVKNKANLQALDCANYTPFGLTTIPDAPVYKLKTTNPAAYAEIQKLLTPPDSQTSTDGKR